MKPSLTQYLKSLPVRGGRDEELRQAMVRNHNKAEMDAIAADRLTEMRQLAKRTDLNEVDQRRLDFFKRRYPEEALGLS